MEEKVEYILKIIEEGGDSFAQRAEMYYKKRPELVNFVEDSFRGYRALAERYDHLSRELQNANRTIATVYPEQVQLALDDEEDDEIFPTKSSSPVDSSKEPAKNLPVVPRLNIPKTPKIPQKKSKAPTRLMSKKGLLKISIPVPATDDVANSGMSKAEALEEIDKFQKNILGLQTEKEFVKSLYESGLAKYWEIEEKITEMQAKVNRLQDEFGIGTFIEDDEARTLMAATALKSCQETLERLNAEQMQSDEEARLECQRIKESHEKLKTLTEKFGSLSTEQKESDKKIDSNEVERLDLELFREKIKEQFEVNCSDSLTMSELAEKIDDLVENVITLATAVSSQNTLVKRLRSEINELQAHLQSLEEEKEAPIDNGSDSKTHKISELEQELLRIRNLNQNVIHRNRNLRIHFTEASFGVDHLSEKLQTVKQDEEVEHVDLFQDLRTIPGFDPEKELQVHKEMVSLYNNSKISKDFKTEGKEKIHARGKIASVEVEEENISQSSLSYFVEDSSHKGQVSTFPDAKQEEFKGNEAIVAHGHDSSISKDVRVGERTKKNRIVANNVYVRTEDKNFVRFKPSNRVDDLLVEVTDVPNANPESKLKENEDVMGLGYDSVISNIMDEEAKKDDVPDQSFPTKAEENSVHADLGNYLDDHFLKGQAISVPNDNLVVERTNEQREMMVPGHDKVITKDVEIEERENRSDSPDHRHHPAKAEEENSFQFHSSNHLEDLSVKSQSNHFDDLPRKGQPGQLRVAQEVVPEREFKENGVIGPGNDSMISQDTIMEHKNNVDSLDYNPITTEENFVESNPSNQILGEVQMQVVQGTNPAKGFEEHEDMVAPVNDSWRSKDAKTKKKEIKNDVSDRSTSVKANEEGNYAHSNPNKHLNSHSQEYQEPKMQENEEKQGLVQTPNDDHNAGLQELETENEDQQPNWRQLFLNGLDDREKILLQQYTSILKNYKEAKKKLGEMEKKTHENLFKSSVQIKELKNANALKDAEIQSLHQKLNLLQVCLDETPETGLTNFSPLEREEGPSMESTTREANSQVLDTSSPDSNRKQVSNFPDERKVEILERKKESTTPELSINRKGEESTIPMIEDKLRSDIDGVLEENIEFWLKFSASFHQIQKFQTSVQDLQEELTKVRERRKHDGNAKHQAALNSDIRPIYKHLREIQTELAMWLEHNSLLEDDLQNRLLSLSSIHEEISRVSNAGSREGGEMEELSNYQAAKFQGEVLNMKQENNKVGYKLQVGLEHVRELRVEIATTISDLEEELGISRSKNRPTSKNSSSRSRIPLRSFLFGVRLRKQKPSSLFQCMSPALQKQYSDLGTLPT
ncbi:hypothetical protein U1Q18_016520 [Sarracenia purpurea var. burkii]